MKTFFLLMIFMVALCNLANAQAPTQTLKLSWSDNSLNEDGFEIERKTGINGVYGLVLKPTANVTNITHTVDLSLTSDITYCYRMRAFNNVGFSGYSNEACVTLKKPAPTTAPAIVSIDCVNCTVTVNGQTTTFP